MTEELRRSARIENQPPKHRRSARITDIRSRNFTRPDTDMGQTPYTNNPTTIEVTIYSNLTPEKRAKYIEYTDNPQPIEPPKPKYSYFANLNYEALKRERALLISDRFVHDPRWQRKMTKMRKERRRIREEERKNRLKTIKSN